MIRPTPRTPHLGLVAVAATLLLGGCTRHGFRERADKDVAGVLTQKNVFPDWKIGNWHVYPHPDARYADPSNPDRPPYPPDDYAARVLSPNPQHPRKKFGTGRYEGDGYMGYLERWNAENRVADAPPLPDAPKPEKLPPPKQPPLAALRPGAPALVSADSDSRLNGPAPGPRVANARPPMGVVVAVGEVPGKNGTMPVVALIPTQQPDPLAPKAADPVAIVATGDAAHDYLKALESNVEGYRITLDQSVELGVLNAREFQDRREDIYLAALPVTLQRFSFAAQAFYTESLIRQNNGLDSATGSRNLWQLNTTTGFNKLFPTGGTLLVRLANQLVIDMTGDKPRTAVTNFTLTAAQPLLRGGGYAVTLEPLAQSERNLLYAIRSYARFRKLFYVSISAGGNITNNPYSFQGLSVNLGRGIGGNLTAPTVGFLPLLLQSAVIANQRKNVVALEELLRQYKAFQEGGQQSDLQVGQVEQQLLNSRTQLLGTANVSLGGGGSGGGVGSGVRGYLDAIDNFKLQLGLPLTVGMDLEETPLRPVHQQLARFEAVYAQLREVELAASSYNPAEGADALRKRWRGLLSGSALTRGTLFGKEIENRWAAWERLTPEQLTRRLGELRLERQKLFDRRADRQAKGLPEPEAEARRLAQLDADIELGGFEAALRGYEVRPWLKDKGPEAIRAQAAAFQNAFNGFYIVILAARNESLAAIRQQWPKLPPLMVNGADLLDVPLEDAYTSAIQTALSYRLDLMNARGQVVDAWRQIKVQANSLQGVLDVQYDLGSSTPSPGNEVLAFSTARSTNRLTINAELPLVRRAERNNYRAALIGYQRQRRTLQAFEDNIANDVRGDLRELRTIAELYRIQQRLIELGYSQVDNAQAILLAPPAPGAQTDAGSAAALTQQVLNAQQQLVTAQNTLYTIWVNYLSSRMTLYLDLESLQLDERGVWCDELIPGSEDPRRPGPARPAGERLPPPAAVPGREQR